MKYDPIHLNCDCSSGTVVKVAGKKRLFGPRCPSCRRVLPPSQWRVMDSVWSKTELGAFLIYRNKLKVKNADVGDFKIIGNYRSAIIREGESIIQEFTNLKATVPALMEQPNAYLRAVRFAKICNKKRV